jgi:hypothetical protein
MNGAKRFIATTSYLSFPRKRESNFCATKLDARFRGHDKERPN